MRRPWTLVVVAALTTALSLAGCDSGGKAKPSSSTTSTEGGNAQAPAAVSGPWRDAAQGTFGGKPWRVQYARSTAGGQCFAPTGAAQPSNAASSLQPGPTRNGARTRCLPPKAVAGAIRFTSFIDGTDANQWVVVGAVTNGITKVSIVFSGGASTPLNIDPHSRLVIWKGPASLHPKQLRTDKTTCAIDPRGRGPNEALCDGVKP
jgi:hypothetical protein